MGESFILIFRFIVILVGATVIVARRLQRRESVNGYAVVVDIPGDINSLDVNSGDDNSLRDDYDDYDDYEQLIEEIQ